ncbi:MAG TPA: GntR family transcriptional regulator [Terriglobales bacterium]|nr:GntR family transcriptional regulator [Terriglobales bacterium]
MILSALDRASVIPLYYQIRQRLLDQISSGTLRPGQPIPSEQRISARLRVSRMTARQALRSLCEDGLAYSRRGKGTFVAEQKQERNINQLLSFTEEMKSHGARSRLLSFSAADPDREAARVLQLGRREKVFQIRRVRLADSVPMAIETSCLPVRLFPGLGEKFTLRGSLYETLAQRYGVQLYAADEIVEAGLASSDDARLLQISPGSPVFHFTRTCYLKSGQPVEYVRSIYRGDRFKIVARLTHQGRSETEGKLISRTKRWSIKADRQRAG